VAIIPSRVLGLLRTKINNRQIYDSRKQMPLFLTAWLVDGCDSKPRPGTLVLKVGRAVDRVVMRRFICFDLWQWLLV